MTEIQNSKQLAFDFIWDLDIVIYVSEFLQLIGNIVFF
jgi:hypothetical protein